MTVRDSCCSKGVNSVSSLQKYCGTFETTGFYFFVCVLDFLGGDAWSISLAAERFVANQASNNITYTEVRYAPQTLAKSPKYGTQISPNEAVEAVTQGLRKGLAAHPELEVYQILCVDRHLGKESCLPIVELAQIHGGGRYPQPPTRSEQLLRNFSNPNPGGTGTRRGWWQLIWRGMRVPSPMILSYPASSTPTLSG